MLVLQRAAGVGLMHKDNEKGRNFFKCLDRDRLATPPVELCRAAILALPPRLRRLCLKLAALLLPFVPALLGMKALLRSQPDRRVGRLLRRLRLTNLLKRKRRRKATTVSTRKTIGNDLRFEVSLLGLLRA